MKYYSITYNDYWYNLYQNGKLVAKSRIGEFTGDGIKIPFWITKLLGI